MKKAKTSKKCRLSKIQPLPKATSFIAFIPPYLWLSNKKSSSLPRLIAESLSFRPILLKHLLPFLIFVMSLILANKSIDITRVSGSGEKGGEAGRWLSKDPEEQVGQHTAIAIGCIPLLSTPILWSSILCLKYPNSHSIVSSCSWKQ